MPKTRTPGLQPLGTPDTTGHTLARMVANGRLLLDHLDLEPPDWPPAIPYVNLAREWINTHPDEWAAMQQPVALPNPLH